MKGLQAKLLIDWCPDDFKYLVEMYKKASAFKYSITSEYEALHDREKRKKLF
jgi:hypothetical protein